MIPNAVNIAIQESIKALAVLKRFIMFLLAHNDGLRASRLAISRRGRVAGVSGIYGFVAALIALR